MTIKEILIRILDTQERLAKLNESNYQGFKIDQLELINHIQNIKDCINMEGIN